MLKEETATAWIEKIKMFAQMKRSRRSIEAHCASLRENLKESFQIISDLKDNKIIKKALDGITIQEQLL